MLRLNEHLLKMIWEQVEMRSIVPSMEDEEEEEEEDQICKGGPRR